MAWGGVSRHRPIIPSNGNRTGKLQVWIYLRVGLVWVYIFGAGRVLVRVG